MPGKKKRGRPRKDPRALARWEPPEGWVRVVAWVSTDERKALKRFAVEADTSVAALIRSLASGLDQGVIEPEELLTHVRKGHAVMDKIPTLFDRGPDFKVTATVRAGCEWVLAGEGTPTEKLDGTNVRLTTRGGQLVRVEKRRNPSKAQKKAGIIDGWYVDCAEDAPEDRWIFEAATNTDVSDWPDHEHSCEALGPKIQGNPLALAEHTCVPFNRSAPVLDDVPREFDGLREFLSNLESRFSPAQVAEGIVFHHPDGRRAKIKRRDFFR